MGIKDFFQEKLDIVKENNAKRKFMHKYKAKLEALGFTQELIETLMDRKDDAEERKLLAIAEQSTSKDEFAQRITNRLKSQRTNIYTGSLLIGNLTGLYPFVDFFYQDISKVLSSDPQKPTLFTPENKDLLQILREHFPEYIINNNERKNTFARTIKEGENVFRDLSTDTSAEELLEDFDKILSGQSVENDALKRRKIMDYILNVLGTYTREDITERFDFILYDIDAYDSENLDKRRQRYLEQAGLTDNQRDRIKDLRLLIKRLQSIGTESAGVLIERIQTIQNDLPGNIEELDDIYLDYEQLYREDMVNRLYVPQADFTIIEDFRDVKPQLVHQFIRSMDQFRSTQIEDLKKKIIAERVDQNVSAELTPEEQERLDKMLHGLEAELDPYKANYSIENPNMVYSDQMGFSYYKSDTSNQISASVLTLKNFLHTSQNMILGVGFNRESLEPSAIALSSNEYQTTNKGVNNIEVRGGEEFFDTSAPISELTQARKTEVVMHRRGEDFDTKAGYILVLIDSSKEDNARAVLKKAQEAGRAEGLKVVVLDTYKITNSYEQAKQAARDKKRKEESIPQEPEI